MWRSSPVTSLHQIIELNGRMKMQNLSLNKLSIIGLLILQFVLFKAIMASECIISFPCVAYSRAEAVFIGKLQKVIKDKDEPDKIVYAYFEVEKVFKGKVRSIEEVKFSTENCKRIFVVGDKYFVYKDNSKYNNEFNRTHPFYEESSDFIYANSLSETNPTFTISGKIEGISENEINSTTVVIEEGQNKYTPIVNKEGEFSFVVGKKAIYHIKIILPFDAKVWVTSGNIGYDVEVKNYVNQTVIKYDLEFKSNSCDIREIWFNKDYKIAESRISGKVIDEFGNPIPKFVISLYPNTLNQDFTNWDFRLAKTNEAGEYVFDKLQPGSYIIGINMGRTPDFELPYPETYFPGKKTVKEAQIINLFEKQNLSLEPFIIPPKLKTVKISGKIIWEDGTPVSRFSPDSSPEQKPRIYLIDPITLKSDLGSLIRTDEQGNFTFLAFENYSYILHADAINTEKQPMHSKHLLIKATKNLFPIILKLSLRGEGRTIEEIKEELGIK